jgi:hypothetical protein
MPTIRISNHLNAEILSVAAGPGSGIAKYFKGDVAGFIASSQLVTALNKSIATLSDADLGLGLSFQADGEFGAAGTEWKLEAGARTSVRATQAGETIPGDQVFGEPLQVATGQTFVSVGFSPSLSAGVSTAVGDLTFGFSIGGSVDFRAGRSFDVVRALPTLGDALGEILSTCIVPGDAADLKTMKPGDVASLSGHGQLKASAALDLAAALNPLATPTLGLQQIGSVQVTAGASVSVAAEIALSGRYQIRVVKVDAQRARLGYYKMRGSQFELDVTASLGASATLGKKELIELLGKLTTAPKADVVALVEAGLSDEQINDIKTAIHDSLNRSLSLSLTAGFASSNEQSAAFEYEFDLSRLDVAGSEALNFALDGNLSKLSARSRTDLPPGVTLLHSELETLKQKSSVWKINLFGIVNVLHITELIRIGKVIVDGETGDLLISDAITGKKITVETRPLVAVPDKLRKIFMQSMILTAAYRASGIQKMLTLEGSMSYFEQVANANPRRISDFLDNFVGVGLASATEKAAFLKSAFNGRASVFLDVAFDDAAFEAMFVDSHGGAIGKATYDQLGRQAVALLIQPGDEQEFRRIPMEAANDALWKQMTELGQFAMVTVMPRLLKDNLRFALVVHDYTVIRWWSAAMSTASKRVVDMRRFLTHSGADAEQLKDDNDFKKKRADLEKSLADVVSNAQPEFLDAWGVVVMHRAAQGRAKARGILLTSTSILVKSRP